MFGADMDTDTDDDNDNFAMIEEFVDEIVEESEDVTSEDDAAHEALAARRGLARPGQMRVAYVPMPLAAMSPAQLDARYAGILAARGRFAADRDQVTLGVPPMYRAPGAESRAIGAELHGLPLHPIPLLGAAGEGDGDRHTNPRGHVDVSVESLDDLYAHHIYDHPTPSDEREERVRGYAERLRLNSYGDRRAGVWRSPMVSWSGEPDGLCTDDETQMSAFMLILTETMDGSLQDMAETLRMRPSAGHRVVPKNLTYRVVARVEIVDTIRQGGDEPSQARRWLTVDMGRMSSMGWSDMSEAVSRRHEQRFIDAVLAIMRESGGNIVCFTRLQLYFTGFTVRGGCDSKRAWFTVNGYRLRSVKSEAGKCGYSTLRPMLCILGKEKRLILSDELKATLSNTVRFMRYALTVFIGPLHPAGICPKDLCHLALQYGVSLTVFSMRVLGESAWPEYPLSSVLASCVEEHPLLPRISMVLLDMNDITAHYVELRNGPHMNPVCDKCGERKAKENGQRRHRCAIKCPDCMHSFYVSNTKHICPVRDAIEMMSSQSPSKLHINRLAQVFSICDGKMDDSERVLQFESYLLEGKSVMMLGDAGTGKTYTVSSSLAKLFTRPDGDPELRNPEAGIHSTNIAFLAHDAIATQNYMVPWSSFGAHVSTIHSFMGANPGLRWSVLRSRLLQPNMRETLARIRNIRLMVIDEVPTCPIQVLSMLDNVLRFANPDSAGDMFGGVQMIMTGDFRQKCPVGCDRPIFLTALWNRLSLSYVVLRRIHRVSGTSHDDREFVTAQLQAARGVIDSTRLKWLHSQQPTKAERMDPSKVTLVNTNEAAHRLNLAIVHHNNFPSEIVTAYALKWPTGVKSWDAWKRDQSDSPAIVTVKRKVQSLLRRCCQELVIAIGTRVMLTENSYSKEWDVFNGSLGVVRILPDLVNEENSPVMVEFDSRSGEALVPVHMKLILHGVRQYPLLLGYSMTICKSQGVTLDNVVVDLVEDGLNSMSKVVGIPTSPGSMYVALGRCSSAAGFRLRGNLSGKVRVDEVRLRFMELCEERYPDGPSEMDIVVNLMNLYNDSRSLSGVEGMDGGYVGERFPLNMTSVTPTLTRKMPSTKRVPLTFDDPFTSHDDRKVDTLHMTLDKTIVFDVETYAGSDSETVYSVAAKYWVRNRVKSQIIRKLWDDGVVDPMSDFMDWMFSIVSSDFELWANSDKSSKHLLQPVTLIAFNGSGFDNYWVMRHIIHGKSEMHDFTKFRVNFTMRGGTIVTLSLHRTRVVDGVQHGHEKSCLRTWDPFLLMPTSLDSMSRGLLDGVGGVKGCFPHTYISRVGAAAAFDSRVVSTRLIPTDFPVSHRGKDLWAFCESEELKYSEVEGWVDFPLRHIHDKYLWQDVNLLTRCVVALDRLCFVTVLPGISILQFPTAASFTMFGFMFTLPKRFQYDTHRRRTSDRDSAEDLEMVMETERNLPPGVSLSSESDRLVRSRLHLPTMEESRRVRLSIYGGKAFPRATWWMSSVCNDYLKREKDLTSADYESLTDCLYYTDFQAMYGSIMKTREFPIGPHLVVMTPSVLNSLLSQLRTHGQSGTPFFIMSLDRRPNEHEVEPPLGAHSAETGNLSWDNTTRKGMHYTSVDIDVGFQRGIGFSNPTWGMVWGVYDEVKMCWSFDNSKAVILKDWMEIGERLKLKGGAVGKMGKLIINSAYGVLLKRDFLDTSVIISDEKTYEDFAMDPNLECMYQDYVKEGKCIVAKYRRNVLPDSDLSRNCAYIGAFVLAYSHQMVDTVTYAANPDRIAGTVRGIRNQPILGDTDSIFVHHRNFSRPEFLAHVKKGTGYLSDDLKDLYSPSSQFLPLGSCTLPSCVEGRDLTSLESADHCMHEIRFAKILSVECPSPKLYALTVILPDGKIVRVKPKSKGIPKSGLHVSMEKGFTEEVCAHTGKGLTGPESWRAETDLLFHTVSVAERESFLSNLSFDKSLTQANLQQVRSTAQTDGGLTCIARDKFKNVSTTRMSSRLETDYKEEYFSKTRHDLHRTILRSKWTGRTVSPLASNHQAQWLIPHGFKFIGQCSDPQTCTTVGCWDMAQAMVSTSDPDLRVGMGPPQPRPTHNVDAFDMEMNGSEVPNFLPNCEPFNTDLAMQLAQDLDVGLIKLHYSDSPLDLNLYPADCDGDSETDYGDHPLPTFARDLNDDDDIYPFLYGDDHSSWEDDPDFTFDSGTYDLGEDVHMF